MVAAVAPFATAVQVLKDHISVDVHSHAGPTGIIARTPPTDDLAKGMRTGRLATVCLADVPDGPLLLSHTALQDSKAMGATRLTGRQISRDHARALAEAGGPIGIWHFFPSLAAYVDGLREMVDVVGVDHVSIGTDQRTAPGSLPDYAVFTTLVGAMLRAGFRPDEAGKVIGGNDVRVFAASAG